MPVVALALTDGAGRWLMHRRPEEKHHGGLWEFPGGKVEIGENPPQALIREIGEELGIALSPADLAPVGFAQESFESSARPIVILLYRCARWEGEPQALEGGAVGWFTPEEVASLDKPPLDVSLAGALFQKMPD
ncbi:(deoxy)nucleoside triphosphate pyrophosphohydrolase [Qipengyuania vesicularis]|uniref:(deoxy)nucleoside triphosphate pyrophosphohydrolase n=1 Tax=Qipengyuania vesicularis TaxID=2867232 RepID=UPI001C88A550|nr:(deoxy)nucleoside triphosphate pyrophosphohydrolase [Qipengyuania vesicularis]